MTSSLVEIGRWARIEGYKGTATVNSRNPTILQTQQVVPLLTVPVPADAISRNISPRELDRQQSKRALNEIRISIVIFDRRSRCLLEKSVAGPIPAGVRAMTSC